MVCCHRLTSVANELFLFSNVHRITFHLYFATQTLSIPLPPIVLSLEIILFDSIISRCKSCVPCRLGDSTALGAPSTGVWAGSAFPRWRDCLSHVPSTQASFLSPATGGVGQHQLAGPYLLQHTRILHARLTSSVPLHFISLIIS